MRVHADGARCQGHGLCNMTAPDVFQLSEEDGHVVIPSEKVPAGLEDDARSGVEACPELALSLIEE